MLTVKTFDELRDSEWGQAGGKAGTLARLYQSGFPVPAGFVILPEAFSDDELQVESWRTIREQLVTLRNGDNQTPLAVRSSALAEDSAQASFAGEFETVLGVTSDEQVRQAIDRVRKSRHSARVESYSQAQGLELNHSLAVIVQRQVLAEYSGILFTADPVSGSRARMPGNFIYGLGDRLVSGEASGQEFSFTRPQGKYEGPEELLPFCKHLFRLALRLERELESPQDIEWAVANRKLYLLQSRPITTLNSVDLSKGTWNASLTGDFLWSNVNFGEAVTEVMTPFSWSVLRFILKDWMNLAGYHPVGNICGRPYLNVSLFATALSALGKSRADLLASMESTLYMQLPSDFEIPLIPLSRRELLSSLPGLLKIQLRQQLGIKKLAAYLDTNPGWCDQMRSRIRAANSQSELLSLWQNEIRPHVLESVWIVLGSVNHATDYTMQLLRDLTPLNGAEDARLLISSLSSRPGREHLSGQLLSLGPLMGLAKVASGELDRAVYLEMYGHRGPNEFELSHPRPAEDSEWLDRQLTQFDVSQVDVDQMLAEQSERFEAAWRRLHESHPRQAAKLKSRIDEVVPRSHFREAARSEYVRDRWVVRTLAVRAGQLLDLEEDVFFLTLQELLEALSGDPSAFQFLPARKETYARYSALPLYPSIIRGRFDAIQWAADPQRRSDIYDTTATVFSTDDLGKLNKIITGAAGSAGRVEGLVRCLESTEEGEILEPGEVLVTVQTDIAWTLIFPRAVAIVTDVGAPLSHAAIVARELGIPAVVGCGDATMQLKTGDRVLVDGSRGVVEIL